MYFNVARQRWEHLDTVLDYRLLDNNSRARYLADLEDLREGKHKQDLFARFVEDTNRSLYGLSDKK